MGKEFHNESVTCVHYNMISANNFIFQAATEIGFQQFNLTYLQIPFSFCKREKEEEK